MLKSGTAPDRSVLRDDLCRGLDQAAPHWLLHATDDQIDRLIDYLLLIHRWNRIDNLSAVREPRDMIRRHLLDSLSLYPHLTGSSILDLGTGAGLPGIPLAIVSPERRFALVDSAAKRIRFVRHALAELGLSNVEPRQQRAEQLEAEGSWDHVTSRAFTSLWAFTDLALPLLTPEGSVLAMKGKLPLEEMESLKSQGLGVSSEVLIVPGEDGERHLIRVCSK